MLADTAELAANLALRGVAAYQAEAAKAVRANQSIDKSMGNVSKTAFAVGGSIGKGVNTAVRNIEKLALVAGGVLVSQVKFGIDSLNRLEEVTKATAQVLLSTRDASGQTAKGIRDMAEAFEDLNATIDDKVIQSAENMLLTFTSIGPKAFKPALAAVLDMNQALGGGEGGLQGVAIQVGKALQDPIRGLTALRRVGVSFTADQEKQIKSLVKHNKLYEAQQLILKELGKEFGGQFAAAGKTATATFAKLGDAVEGAQQALATALLPALTDVAKELTSLIEGHQADIAAFGKSLAGGFKDAVTWAKGLDWNGIGGALKTAAGAAKGLVDAFVKAPAWLQTAVITGWGLNKLTGGALTGIGGEIAKGLGARFLDRGSSAGNPLWVQSVPGVGGGGPGGLSLTALLAALGITIAAQEVANSTIPNGANAYNTSTSPSGFGPNLIDPNAAAAKSRANGGTLIDRLIAALKSPGLNANVGKFQPMQGPPKPGTDGSSHSEDRRLEMQSIEAIRANTTALKLTGKTIEKNWLKSIDPEDIAARSKAKSGHAATPAQIAAIRTRDELHQLKVITEKSQASSAVKLERLRVLAADAKAHGDTKTAAKVNQAIKDMKAKVAAEQVKTTGAVGAAAGAITGAIATHQSDVNVYVTTTVSASDIATTTVTKERMGPGPGSSNNKKVGTA